MKRTVKLTLDWKWLTGLILVIAVAIGGVVVADRSTQTLPEDVQKNITFSPMVIPEDSKGFSATSYQLSKAEDETQVLSYVVKTDGSKKVTVSEYAQPPQFSDVAEYKQQFLANVAQQYDSVETTNGTIYLGKQAKNNNRQLGLMIEKGLLIFLNPEQDLDKAEWRRLGEQLELQKV